MAHLMTLQQPAQNLVLQAQGGDVDAFEELIRRYRGRLERQVEVRMGPALRGQMDPGDLLQETLAKAFESIGHFRWQGEDSFYRWLAGIAEHLIWKAAKKRPLEPLRLDPKDPKQLSPEKRLRRKERFERLQAALAGLSREQREAIRLSRLEGLSLKEAAQRMGKTAGAVQKLVARGLIALRRSLGDTESLHLPEGTLEEKDEAADE
jgi:RNA polymerase sigma-70 factor (ECF subfamily)